MGNWAITPTERPVTACERFFIGFNLKKYIKKKTFKKSPETKIPCKFFIPNKLSDHGFKFVGYVFIHLVYVLC